MAVRTMGEKAILIVASAALLSSVTKGDRLVAGIS
jgi:hypothetical protein